MSRYDDTISVVEKPEELTQDDYSGNEVAAWDAAQRVPRTANVYPDTTVELTAGRQTTVTTWLVVCELPRFSDENRVEWDGDSYEVDGNVGLFKSRGVPDHLEFRMKRVEGA